MMDFNDEGDLVLQSSGWDKLYISPPVESKYAITGTVSQVITFSLDSGESIQSEPGAMMYMSNEIMPNVTYEGCWGRCCSGESCYSVNYVNTSSPDRAGFLALTPSYPTAKVVPVDMSVADVGGKLIAQPGAFMASYGDVEVSTSYDFSLTGCCGGAGPIRQKLKGTGTVFLAATGTIVQKILAYGEVILVDDNCLLAFARSVTIGLKTTGGIVGMFGSGEGITNTELTGPGLVLIQSMSEFTFKKAMQANKIYRR